MLAMPHIASTNRTVGMIDGWLGFFEVSLCVGCLLKLSGTLDYRQMSLTLSGYTTLTLNLYATVNL